MKKSSEKATANYAHISTVSPTGGEGTTEHKKLHTGLFFQVREITTGGGRLEKGKKKDNLRSRSRKSRKSGSSLFFRRSPAHIFFAPPANFCRSSTDPCFPILFVKKPSMPLMGGPPRENKKDSFFGASLLPVIGPQKVEYLWNTSAKRHI